MSSTADTIAYAVSIALQMAADARHGYSQVNRWGPDYDCSSFLIQVWTEAGVNVRAAGATYTGNMRPAFLACGFADVTDAVQLLTGQGLQRGDVLLNYKQHAAMAIGGGYIVHASGSETGGTDGQTGDQTGREIGTAPYYYSPSAPWDCVLRYVKGAQDGAESPSEPSASAPDEYVVQASDSLWKIAREQLGDENRWPEIQKLNGLPGTVIYPGQVLRLPVSNLDLPSPEPELPPVLDSVSVELPVLRLGCSGRIVETLQLLLQRWHFALPVHGVDGDFGAETQKALLAFQAEWGLDQTGQTDCLTWVNLIG